MAGKLPHELLKKEKWLAQMFWHSSEYRNNLVDFKIVGRLIKMKFGGGGLNWRFKVNVSVIHLCLLNIFLISEKVSLI